MYRYFLCIIAVFLVAACKKEQYATGVITMTTTMDFVSIEIISLTDVFIDWGDGEKSDNNTGDLSVLGKLWITHNYSSKSEHRITITGNNIVSLNCGINQLTTLDVSRNIKLTSLNCLGNPLTILDVSRNTKLTSLDCSGNQLTTLNVSRNTKLTSLDCSENQLTTLNVSRNTKLTSFYCSENQLRTLDVSHNNELKYLSCYSNKLTAAALNDLFRTLHNYGGFIFIWDNPGASDCDFSIAEGKGWNVYRYM